MGCKVKRKDGKNAFSLHQSGKMHILTTFGLFSQILPILGNLFFSLPISVGALYVRTYFNQDAKKAADELVDNVRDEFLGLLNNVSWMDDKTREEATRKANAITEHIGYPNELADNNKLEEFFRDLEIAPDNLLLNTLRLSAFDDDYTFGQLRKAVNKTDWVTHSKPALVNALYSSLENSIRKFFLAFFGKH